MEIDELERQVRQMQGQIEMQMQQEQSIKGENSKLMSAIQDGRDKDTRKNQKLVDSIVTKDREFDQLERELHGKATQRIQDLKKFNEDCESASKQTQKTETSLKEKDSERVKV